MTEDPEQPYPELREDAAAPAAPAPAEEPQPAAVAARRRRVLPEDEAEAAAADETEAGGMSLWDHLEELRWVIFRCVGALAVGTVAGWYLLDPAIKLMMRPLGRIEGKVDLFFDAPMSAFMSRLQLAGLTGCILASPLVLWFLAGFISPALYAHERKVARLAIVAGAVFFLGGVASGYAMLFPALPMFIGFSFSGVKQLWSLNVYLSFCLHLMLAVGLSFELPVVLIALVRLGILSAAMLSKARPYAVVGIFVLAALITPTPDIFTQMMVGMPMWFFYEVSAWYAHRREKKKAVSNG